MGEHDQAVLHDEDAHGNIHDDGRTLRQGGLVYNSGYPVAVPGPGVKRAFVYRGEKLIPDTLYVHSYPFNTTKWESLYSSVFGTGTEEVFDAVSKGRVEPGFAPIVDDSHRVIGHVGWIDGHEICVPKDTIRDRSKLASILEKMRLGEWRQQLLAEADKFDRGPYPNSRFHAVTMSPPPGPKPAPCVPPAPTIKLKPTIWDDARRGPLRDKSEELRHRNNLNYFLKAGGKALIGRKSAGDLLQGEYEPYLLLQQVPLGEDLYDLWHDRKSLVSSEYRFLVLVSPEGHLQSVLQVEKVEQERLTTLDIAFEVIDTTLTVLMIIDIPVVLFRAGVVVARAAAIRAIEVAIEREAKASLELAIKIAQAEARGVVLRGAMAGPKETAELAAKAFWDASRAAPKQLSEAQVDYWTKWTANRMRQLGIPEKNIGCEVKKFRVGKPKKMIGKPSKLPGDSGKAFNPMGTERGSNLRSFVEDGTVHEGGISVHSSVFQPWKGFEIWNKAAIEDRIEAIIAHEWLEFNGLSHELAVARFEQSTLNISKKAKEILAYMKTQLVP
jgi:hypothetical protein